MDSYYTASDYFGTNSRYLGGLSGLQAPNYTTAYRPLPGLSDLMNDDLFDLETDLILNSNRKTVVDFKMPAKSKIPKLAIDYNKPRNANSLDSIFGRKSRILEQQDQFDSKSIISSRRAGQDLDSFDDFYARNRLNQSNKFTNSIDRRLAKLQINQKLTQIPSYKYNLKQTNYFLEPDELRTKINKIKNPREQIRLDDKNQSQQHKQQPFKTKKNEFDSSSNSNNYTYYTIDLKDNDQFFVNNNKHESLDKENKKHSADVDVTTVSSMLSSENQSPMNKSELNTAERPFKPNEIQFQKINNQSNSFKSAINYEQHYKQETMKRIRAITQVGDVAYGIDSIPQEDEDTKLEKETKRKMYGNFVKERLNQLNLSERHGYATSKEQEDDKTQRYKTRQEYARSIKEINDDELERNRQRRLTKTILPLIDKKGSQLVKQKSLKQSNVTRRSTYADYVKERNQILIEDQKSQRVVKQLQNQEKLLKSSFEPLNDPKDGVPYSKSFNNKKPSYFVNLRDE